MSKIKYYNIDADGYVIENGTERYKEDGNILFSRFLANKTHTKKIAYLGLFAAFSIVISLFEIPIGATQISLTILASAIIGILSGAGSGFAACFIGDLIGFMITKPGLTYSPFIGISSGLFAFFAGLLTLKIAKRKWFMYFKIAIYCIFTLFVCTIFINTTYMYFAYNKNSLSYFNYVIFRLFTSLQIVNSIVNYALLFIVYPYLKKIKPLQELFN